MCIICSLTQTFDPARHENGQPVSAALSEGVDAAENIATIYSMSVGDTFTGTISSSSDEDWIAITLVAGQSYVFNHEGSPTGAGSLSDPYLRIFNSSGVQVASNDDGGTGFNASINFTASYSGNYFIEADAYSSNTGSYRVSVVGVEPPDFASLDELALQLTEGFWGDREHTFSTTDITVNLSGLSLAGQQLARWAMEAWEMVANLTFREVPFGEMITVDNNSSGAFAYSPGGSGPDGVEMNVSSNWLTQNGTTLDSYSFQTFVHEFGHAIGLGHMGDYDGSATYGLNNLFQNDSWQTSVMSYFDQNDNTDINASYGYTMGPMMADVLAIQNLYGTPSASSPTAGDTTYGANTTLNNYIAEIFDWWATGTTTSRVTGNEMVLNLYDRDGFDTLDLNFSNTSDRIDLRQETFSDALGMIGNISISRGTMIEALVAGSGNDTITGNDAGNRLEGRDGNDSIESGLGNDTVYGGINNDTIGAGEGADRVWGGDGRDLVYLNQGDDIFYDNAQGGASGSDTVYTGLGNDTIEGGNGGDVFYGEDGNDVINGRLGDDTIYGGNQFDTISAGEGNDRVWGDNGQDLVFLNQGDDIFYDNAQGGELGRDTVYTGLGNDTVFGGNGDDRFFGEDGNDVINGGLGNDTIFGGGNFDTISAGEGNDVVYGDNGRDLVFLNQGDDLFNDNAQGGELGRDTVFAGLGNDTVQGGNGDDQFYGEDGNDLLIGRLGNDTIGGGAGNDTIDGGAGSDTLTGAAGVDTFIFAAADAATGTDLVTDFLLGTDVFRMSGTSAGSVSVDYNTTANQVTVSVGGNDVAILRSGSDLSGFGVDDMVFV